MHVLLNRYHRVRTMGAYGYSEPYIWDYGRAQDRPRMLPAPYGKGIVCPDGWTHYPDDGWLRSPSGEWIRSLSGGAYVRPQQVDRMYLTTISLRAPSISLTTLALDSAYTNAVGGDAIASRFVINANDTLSTVYFNVQAYTGTAANVNDLNLELRDNNTTTGPGSTLHESKTKDPASATGWIASTGWTFSVSGGTQYWLVLGDADGNGTDYATVTRNTNRFGAFTDFSQALAWQTTDGWSSVRTSGNAIASLVLIFSSGRTSGIPYTATANSTSSTNRRGLRFVAPASMAVYAIVNNNVSSNNFSGIELWTGADGPSGSPTATGTVSFPNNNLTGVPVGFAFATPPQLSQGGIYRLVYTYGAALTAPQKAQIGTGADSTIATAMEGGGAWYWTEANGTTDWSNDNTTEFPIVDVVVDDFVTNTSGGISSGLHTIMDGIVA